MARPVSRHRSFGDTNPERRRLVTARLLGQAAVTDDIAERDRLLEEVVLANLDVAQSIASRYRDRGIPLEDLEQVACAALVRVVQRFDGAHERDLLAYAVPSIRGEVRRYFRDHGWTVRPPRRLQELRVQVLEERDRQRAVGEEGSDRSIAAVLDVAESEVGEALATTGCFIPVSLDQRVGEDDATSIGDLIADPASSREQAVADARLVLRPVMRRLKPRDQRLLKMRFEDELTQQEIAESFGVTQSQVSRLLERVLRDLRDALADDAAQNAGARPAIGGASPRSATD